MKKQEILDDNFFDEQPTSLPLIFKIKAISKWWFYKRIQYNGIIILFQAVIFLLFYKTIHWRFGIFEGLRQAGAFTVVANILFSLGSIVEIIAVIFKRDLSEFRKILWLIGLWFSILLTAYMYLGTVN